MTDRKMLLGMQLGTTYGAQATAWRSPHVNRENYTDFDAYGRHGQLREGWSEMISNGFVHATALITIVAVTAIGGLQGIILPLCFMAMAVSSDTGCRSRSTPLEYVTE